MGGFLAFVVYDARWMDDECRRGCCLKTGVDVLSKRDVNDEDDDF